MKLQLNIRKIAALTLVLALGAGLAACQEPEPQGLLPEEEVLETQPPVQVDMRGYSFEYSGDLAEDITLKENKESGDLEFFVSLSGSEAPLFTLRFNSDEGDFVTVIRDASDVPVPVAFRMEQIPEGLEEADETLFCTAQEEVNAIAASIVLK